MPMDFTDAGTSSAFSAVQPLKALWPMLIKPSGSFTEARAVQSVKVQSSMLLTFVWVRSMDLMAGLS